MCLNEEKGQRDPQTTFGERGMMKNVVGASRWPGGRRRQGFVLRFECDVIMSYLWSCFMCV